MNLNLNNKMQMFNIIYFYTFLLLIITVNANHIVKYNSNINTDINTNMNSNMNANIYTSNIDKNNIDTKKFQHTISSKIVKAIQKNSVQNNNYDYDNSYRNNYFKTDEIFNYSTPIYFININIYTKYKTINEKCKNDNTNSLINQSNYRMLEIYILKFTIIKNLISLFHFLLRTLA